MKKTRPLNFDVLPMVDKMEIFIQLNPDVAERINNSKYLIEVRERSRAALMFFSKPAGDTKDWRNAAYLRAGLNEFYSIEDAARRDWKQTSNTGKPPRICESVNPLVHFTNKSVLMDTLLCISSLYTRCF